MAPIADVSRYQEGCLDPNRQLQPDVGWIIASIREATLVLIYLVSNELVTRIEIERR